MVTQGYSDTTRQKSQERSKMESKTDTADQLMSVSGSVPGSFLSGGWMVSTTTPTDKARTGPRPSRLQHGCEHLIHAHQDLGRRSDSGLGRKKEKRKQADGGAAGETGGKLEGALDEAGYLSLGLGSLPYTWQSTVQSIYGLLEICLSEGIQFLAYLHS